MYITVKSIRFQSKNYSQIFISNVLCVSQVWIIPACTACTDLDFIIINIAHRSKSLNLSIIGYWICCTLSMMFSLKNLFSTFCKIKSIDKLRLHSTELQLVFRNVCISTIISHLFSCKQLQIIFTEILQGFRLYS